ncbi:hypothetical protein MTR67_001291 [Solanum verrucosum]|uniref:Uncharacterized protein n=1 Tax=Solanum verrucosum TaxID=315347 RepID=A0AAF0PN99_SOLVR|nr:hypothetical protein MTR67_001291 [Solanum verrucosum]
MIPEFAEGVTRLINHAMTLDDFLNSRLIRCPCVNCENVRYHTTETVAMHLMMNGFKPGYTVWTSHGEVESDTMFNNFVIGESSRSTEHNYFQGSRMSDIINDAFGMHSDFEQGENVEEAPNEEANIFYEQLRDCSSHLFNGSQHSKLSVAVRLLSIKSNNNISQGAMDSMIELMKELVDPNVEIPDSYYKANALVSKLGLSSIRIDCCEKGCMLYYKEDVNLESCKFCSHPRYKIGSTGKKLAIKAMHYLPLIPRLKRLYASNSSAPHMRWHRENRRPPGVMCHPSDGEAWKHFDRTYPDFAAEPRNVRLGLCANGFTPFSVGATPYSCWPVFITPYNLPPENSWFDCHRRFLPPDHEFRRKKYAFKKNKTEGDGPPPILTGDDIWERVQNFPKVTEEPPYKFDGYGVAHNWTKQSILWELPYWKDNLLRLNLDVMHIEKNYFDNLFNTVMDVIGKTKDNVKARLDLPEHCRRPELRLQESANNKLLKPKASYSFTMEQKRKICEWVESLKMPDGHASNLGKRVDIERGILHGMKSHDCHVFMEQLLPIAFCGLPENIWKPMAEISLFFKDLCSSTLRVENLVRMAKSIVVISNKLEKILPPGFFDVMEHLPIHLVHEALLGGPVQYRWMYPFERSIDKSKRGIKNKHRVEGCMTQVYLAKERSHFCSYHLDDYVSCLRNRPNRHDVTGNDPAVQSLSIFNQPGKGSKKRTLHKLTEKEKKFAELHVLLNCPEVQPFLDYFVSQYGHDQVLSSFITWYTNWKYSKNKKTNNSGVWVKGDNGNQNENVDYFGVLQEIVELEYSGWPIKRIVLFQCKWFDPTSRGTRELKQHNIIEVKHTRKYEAYDPFIIAQNAKQVYYAPYPLCRDKSDWWVVIKTKPMGRVEVENELDVVYQNEISSVHQVVDAELEMNLEHPDHILEEVNREELDMPTNMEEDEEKTFEENEWIDEEETSEDDACEWIDDEETSEEDE